LNWSRPEDANANPDPSALNHIREQLMGQWVRCTLESDEKQGEQKLVRHLNLDYYVRMERSPNNTTLLRSVSGAGDMHVMETPEELLAQGERLQSAAAAISGN
jgi:hypothetical protein